MGKDRAEDGIEVCVDRDDVLRIAKGRVGDDVIVHARSALGVNLKTRDGGLPIGLQIVGRNFEEGAILRLARHQEQDQ